MKTGNDKTKQPFNKKTPLNVSTVPDLTGDVPPTETVTEEVPIIEEEIASSIPTDILTALKNAVTEGILVQDFKTQLALSGMMKDTDDLLVGRLGRIGLIHMSIINKKESSTSYQVLIGGKMTPMKKEDYDKYYMQGIYFGSDLIIYTDNDSLILLKGSFELLTDGSIVIF